MKMRPNGSFFFISSLIDRFSESLLEFFQILLNFKVSSTKYLFFFVRSRLIREIEENFFFEQTKLQYANIARDRETWPCFS